MRPIQSISTRAELLALGFTDEAIRRAAKTGTLDYLGPGLYGPPDDAGTRESRHRGVVQAWTRKVASGPRGETRALAEVSAAAALGLLLFGLPVNQFVAQDFSHASGSRSTRRVRLVSDRRPVSLVNLADIAIPVVSPARAVVDIARRHSRIPAIVVGDAALHDGLCTRSELHYELDLARGLCGVAHARVAVELMDGLSESVLESRSRIEMRDAGLPAPELQPSFYVGGLCLGRADFWWPEFLLIGEADGDLKYRDDAAAAYREKQRTDAFNQVGIRVVRWNWRHANNPAELSDRVVAKMSPPLAQLDPAVVLIHAVPRG